MNLPDNKPFYVTCINEQSDFFQYEFFNEYIAMTFRRKVAAVMLAVTLILGTAATVAIYSSSYIAHEFGWVSIFFTALYSIYNIYIFAVGYKSDYRALHRQLSSAIEKGLTVFAPVQTTYQFFANNVELTCDNGAMDRMFDYSDIRYVEKTDRLYIIGLKYNRKKASLYNFHAALIAYRYLDAAKLEKLESVLSQVVSEYELKPILKNHPFKPEESET
ncbi:MAG: hypothetical protein RR058_06595 [Oscillospiraceae bacterium]